MVTTVATASDSARGFLLVTLHDVEALLPEVDGRIVGDLALQYISLSASDGRENGGAEDDIWLVLRIGAHEMLIAPTQVIKHTRSERTFIFEGGGGYIGHAKWAIKLPEPTERLDLEGQETFEVILAQYAAVEEVDALDVPPPNYSVFNPYPVYHSNTSTSKRAVPPPPAQRQGVPGQSSAALAPPPPLPSRTVSKVDTSEEGEDLRGRLVLVDENDGKVVGTLGEQFHIREDEALSTKGHEKDPVIIELPEYAEGEAVREVYVHPVPVEMQDTMMKTASIISRGLVYVTDTITTGFGAASSFYIAHSTPTTQPLVFSESTRGHVRRIHGISGKAVEVSAKTTGLIHDMLERAVGYVSGSNDDTKGKAKGKSVDVSKTPTQLPLKNRILLSTDMLLTTVEHSAKQLVEHGTLRLSEALSHKYGKDVGDTSLLVGHAVRNVGLVYIDARGIGRRALLKQAGKGFIKAKLGKHDVVLGVDENRTAQGLPRSVSPAVSGSTSLRSEEGASSGPADRK